MPSAKQTGIGALILAALAAVWAFVEAHPFIVGGSIAALILAFLAWRLLRKKES